MKPSVKTRGYYQGGALSKAPFLVGGLETATPVIWRCGRRQL